ncbi:MAG TPA: neutral/alkaline non-lysosomal ceramidase N-terminal domain-containing protein, partial [Anaeromyxobacteraceae bacterium]|nr:neutral/alkaline non-lysosomal ceramidase N-terminal domain-containing protein [Anaeromyxobacteraceae bacterium]
MKKNPTPRRARRLVLASLILPISLGILSLPWRGARPPRPPVVEAAQVGHGPLQAGAASRVVDLGAAPTIGGFPRFRWGAAGVKDPITARALVLSEPGCTVALASAELLVVPGALERAVSARLAGAGVDALVVAATHTHAGPGGYWDSLPGELGATGPYDAATFERVADAVAGAVRDALAARAPATLAVARGRFPELVRNRGGGSVDGRVLSVRVARPGGEPVAELVSFAAHPTMLGGRNRLVSGDWPARLLAGAKGGTRLFFQGAVGDQSTHLLPGDEEADPLDAYAGALDGYLARLEAGP